MFGTLSYTVRHLSWKLVETSEGQTLELESEEGTETWRKIKPDAPKIVSRKKGGLPRIFTKEGQQGSNQPEEG